jgi:putative acetyltransferase
MLLRRERPDDVDVIGAIHRAAFAPYAPEGGPTIEDGLVVALRADAGWVSALSIVAEDADGVVVGHVVATEGRLGDAPVVGIGPLGVRPDRQGSGVGGALVHAVVAVADALGYPLVALLGEPAYYRRFGFVPAADLGVEAPDPSWGDFFQARPLAAHAGETGTFRYAAPFDDL